MRRVEDGGRHQRAIDAAVGDGEGAALHLCDLQLPVTRALAVFGDGLLDAGKGQHVGIAQHGNDEALLGAHRHADVVEVLVDDVVAVDLGVDRRNLLQCLDAGLHEEAHEAQLHAVLLLEQLLVLVAQRHGRRHVDLVEGRQHGGGVLRILQAARDGEAQARHLHTLLARGIRRRWCGCGSGCRWLLKVRDHVALGEAPILAGAGDG